MLNFRTKDHPEANGRIPELGEQQWIYVFILEDGSKLSISGGRESRNAFRKMFEQEELDDLAESNPKDN
jgi:hypothetical protein